MGDRQVCDEIVAGIRSGLKYTKEDPPSVAYMRYFDGTPHQLVLRIILLV